MENKEEAPKEEAKVIDLTPEQIEKYKASPEFAAILNQHGKTYHEMKAEETGASYMGKAYNNVDIALLEEIGLKERPTGKTTELVRNLAKEKKALEAKLAKLNDKPDTTEVADEAKKLHETRVSTLEQQLADQLAENETLKAKGLQKDIATELNKGLVDITFNPALSKTLLDETITNRMAVAIQNSKQVEGRTVFYKDNGEPYAHLNGLPLSAKEMGLELFKDIIHVKKAGGNADGLDKPVVKGDILTLPNPDSITTFVQFNAEFKKAMAPKGWASHEERYIKLAKATIDHYFKNGLPME